MAFAGLNELGILAAGAAGWLIGALWYAALGKPWMAAQGWRSREEMLAGRERPSPLPFIIAFAAELVMAWVLAGIVGHLGAVTIRNGLIAAGFAWLGFVATSITVNNAFGGRRTLLTLIDGGHWLAVLLVMGAVIGAFGV